MKRLMGYRPTLNSFDEVSSQNTGYVNTSPVDWRTGSCMNPVKDQGQCGSCWTFSTVGAIETNYCNKTGTLYSLSEQEFVDCDKFINNGCNGGNFTLAFNWARSHSVVSESDYPYKGVD